MFKPKLPQQEQGFTLVEVLVAILIATLFVSVAMQAIVLAAIFKARAQEFAEATTWIQENLENVKYEAANFQYTSLTANSVSGTSSSSINVASVANLANNDKLIVGSASGTYTISNISGNTLTITPKLSTVQLQGAVVVATTRCNANVDTGFADGLRDKITGSNPTVTNYVETTTTNSNLTNKPFTFRRTTTRFDAAPYNVLQVSYDVSPTSGGSLLTYNAASRASSITVASAAKFAVNDRLKVGSAPGTYRISAINGNALSITPPLGTAQSIGAAVVATVADFYTEVLPNAALQCP